MELSKIIGLLIMGVAVVTAGRKDRKSSLFSSCPSDIVHDADHEQINTVINWQVTVKNNSRSVTLEQTSGPSTNTLLEVGSYKVSFTAKDNNRTSSCTFTVTVNGLVCKSPGFVAKMKTGCNTTIVGGKCNMTCNKHQRLLGDSVITCWKGDYDNTYWKYETFPHCIDDYVFMFHNRGKDVIIKCPDHQVIYNITLTSKNISLNCYGLQHTVLVAMLNCYWKNTCSIRLGYTEIITYTVDEIGSKCMGHTPDVLLYNVSCIHQDMVFLNNSVDIKENRQSEGLIKSHDSYPWHYTAPIKSLKWQGHVELVRPSRDHQVLYMNYVNYDLAEQDVVNVGGTEKWTGGLMKTTKDVNVTFIVKPGVTFSGFIICFKWMMKDSIQAENAFSSGICGRDSLVRNVIDNEFKGWIIGPSNVTLAKPCKCKLYLRVGILQMNDGDDAVYIKGARRNRKNVLGSFNVTNKFPIRKKMKKIDIMIRNNTILCFRWTKAKKPRELKCDSSFYDNREAECPKKCKKKQRPNNHIKDHSCGKKKRRKCDTRSRTPKTRKQKKTNKQKF